MRRTRSDITSSTAPAHKLDFTKASKSDRKINVGSRSGGGDSSSSSSSSSRSSATAVEEDDWANENDLPERISAGIVASSPSEDAIGGFAGGENLAAGVEGDKEEGSRSTSSHDNGVSGMHGQGRLHKDGLQEGDPFHVPADISPLRTPFTGGSARSRREEQNKKKGSSALQLARAEHRAASTPKVEEWKAAFTADGRVYYYNRKTRHSQWNRPETGRSSHIVIVNEAELGLLSSGKATGEEGRSPTTSQRKLTSLEEKQRDAADDDQGNDDDDDDDDDNDDDEVDEMEDERQGASAPLAHQTPVAVEEKEEKDRHDDLGDDDDATDVEDDKNDAPANNTKAKTEPRHLLPAQTTPAPLVVGIRELRETRNIQTQTPSSASSKYPASANTAGGEEESEALALVRATKVAAEAEAAARNAKSALKSVRSRLSETLSRNADLEAENQSLRQLLDKERERGARIEEQLRADESIIFGGNKDSSVIAASSATVAATAAKTAAAAAAADAAAITDEVGGFGAGTSQVGTDRAVALFAAHGSAAKIVGGEASTSSASALALGEGVDGLPSSASVSVSGTAAGGVLNLTAENTSIAELLDERQEEFAQCAECGRTFLADR